MFRAARQSPARELEVGADAHPRYNACKTDGGGETVDRELRQLLAEIAQVQAEVMDKMATLSQEDLRFKTSNWR